MEGKSALNLFVAGVQSVVMTDHNRIKELELARLKQHQSNNKEPSYVERKLRPSIINKIGMINQNRSSISTESSLLEKDSTHGSELSYEEEDQKSIVTTIWVNISKKLAPPADTQRVPSIKSSTPKSPFSISRTQTKKRQSSLPDAFQNFMQQKLQLIAEIETAKYKRSLNHHISRSQEETDWNWTSNAPRPSSLSSKRKQSKTSSVHDRRRNKDAILSRPTEELNTVLQGIHLEGKNRQVETSKHTRQRRIKPKKKILRLKRNKQIGKLQIGEKKRVTFLLPDDERKQDFVTRKVIGLLFSLRNKEN